MTTPRSPQIAIVTGSTKGIGKAIATELIDRGIKVFGTGTSPQAAMRTSNYEIVQADFTCAESLQRFCQLVREISPDILINNAGVSIPGKFIDYKHEDFEKMLSINLRAPAYITQAALPGMVERNYGRVLNLCSIWGVIGKKERALYCSTKFAIDGLTAALSAEFAQHNILINSIAPGFTRTEATEELFSEAELSKWANEIPLNRLAAPAEMAKAAAWLVSPDNSYMSGQNVVIDGGLVRV